MPMSILEAMSSGCVVITTLEDKSMLKLKGYILVNTTNGASDKLAQLITDENSFMDMSLSNRNYARDNFGANKIAKKYIEVIDN